MSRLLLVGLLALAACSPSANGPNDIREYAFILANPTGLLALDAEGRVLGALADLPRDSAPSAPSLYPDGKRIAFAIFLAPRTDTGFGSDVWVLDLERRTTTPLLEHEAENVFYSSPLVDPSGNVLYVQRRAAIIQGGTYVGNEDTIERIDLTTKQRTRVVDQAGDLTLSPDGKTIVYVKLVDGQPQGLWRVNVDGTGAGPFFTIEDTWWYLQAPRFSRDGTQIIFSGAGHNARSRGPVRGLAHLGIPSDLFLAPADGSFVRSIGQTGDDVVPAWSPDGGEVAFVALGALHVVRLTDGNVRQLSHGETFFFGDLVWMSR